MKLLLLRARKATAGFRVAVSVTLIALLPLLLYASAPSWWSQRGVLVENAEPDDYSPANQGQLKNIAKAAAAEMDARLAGGAGDELHALITSWSVPNATTNDFAPINLGQLKSVAKPFYDRLIAAGLVDFYPWLSAATPADDFAVANIGQVKNLFGFQIPTSNSLADPLQNRLAAGRSVGNLALQENAVWLWGDTLDDFSFQRTYPRRVAGLSDVRSVAAGDDHMLALLREGTVLAWGKNNYGQLGDGTNIDRDTPSAVLNLFHVVSVKAGSSHAVALLQDGTVVAWGDNYYGQLGDGSNSTSSSPVPVIGLTDVRKIAAGAWRSAALKTDGTVWTWGYDHYAPQVGQDISNNTPVQVDDLNDVVDIAVGFEHFVVVKADGTVWAWGSNYANQLGNGSPTSFFQEAPVQIPGLANVTKVASSLDHTLALLNDGTVWAWGRNFFGQLGDATTTSRKYPVPVTGLTGVVAIATSYQYSLAMKADGTVWTWGDGSAGTLPGVDLHVPQQVGLGLFDSNHNGMDDRWEIQFLGNLNHLGKDRYPIRINNQGQILIVGNDDNGNWGNFRWKGGVMERLTYAGISDSLSVHDMNDSGIVVGEFFRISPWVNNAENELAAGLTWPADKSEAVKTSAPVAAPSWYFREPGTVKWAGFTAITNNNDIFGKVRTSGGHDGFFDPFEILNAYLWREGSPTRLSFGEATYVPATNSFTLSGEIDSVSRANRNGHYIGTKLVPQRIRRGNPASIEGTFSGMIDGQTVSFNPIDINEAGIVVGSAGADMIVSSSPTPTTTISGASPLAINDHTRPAPSPLTSPAPSPLPTPIPAPQILAWVGNALVVWERQDDGQTWHPFGLQEMIPSMAGWEYLEPYDMNDNGLIVGRAWYTDPSIPGAQGEYHAFLLVPVEIVPDYNRDGKIDENDRGRVTESEPWRWWINDDDDNGEVKHNDSPLGANDRNSDCFNDIIDGSSDLLDFFPVHFDIKNLLDVMPHDGVEYRLVHSKAALRVTFTSLSASEAGKFLRDSSTTDRLANSHTELVLYPAANGTPLPADFVRQIRDNGMNGVALFEASAASEDPLRLQVWQNGRQVTEVELPLKTDEVDKMYRWINLRSVVHGGSEDRQTNILEPPNGPDRLTNEKHVVFVHGYNVSEEAARGWNAEVFKRLYHSGSCAKFTALVWRGNQGQLPILNITTDYWENVTNAFITAAYLPSIINSLPGEKIVVAHSLGNIVTASAIADHGLHVEQLLQVDAALGIEALDETVDQASKMRNPDWASGSTTYPNFLWAYFWHSLFPEEDGRRGLTWRHRFGAMPNAVNFYSSGEEVLNNSEGVTPDYGAEKAWALQELLKGTHGIAATLTLDSQGGWGFNSYWFVDQAAPGSPSDVIRRRRQIGEVAEITPEQVRTHPFFEPFQDSRLMDPQAGSLAAFEYHTRSKTLAEGIPALSFAVGRNEVAAYGSTRNVDMMGLKTGWPKQRLSDAKMIMPDGEGRWLHTDIADVAFSYVYKVFDYWCAQGDLR